MPPAMAGAAPSKSTARGKGVVDYNYGLFAPSLSAHTHYHNHNHNHTSNLQLPRAFRGLRGQKKEGEGAAPRRWASPPRCLHRQCGEPSSSPPAPCTLQAWAAAPSCCYLLLLLPAAGAASFCSCPLLLLRPVLLLLLPATTDCSCCCYLLLLTAAAAAASCCSCRPLLLHPMLLRLLLLLPLAAVPPLMYLPLAVTAACYTRAAITVCELCSVHEHLV
jgi:hypothetical protein